MEQNNPLRSSDLRVHNQKIILSRIYESRNTGISQSKLVAETGLRAPTVFRIFSSLEEQGLIEILDENEGNEGIENDIVHRGRRPVIYTVCKDALYTIGLEFWAFSISIGVFNFNGDRVFSRIEHLRANISINKVIDIIVSLVNEALEGLGINRNKVAGIGIAAPGQIDLIKRRVVNYPRIRGMRDMPLADELENRLGITVLLHNNCSVIALSEYHHGGYDHQGSLFTFLLRSGVNGAFVDQRGIYTTSQGITLESGHVPIDSHSSPCTCGIGGCLESHLRALDEANAKTGKPLFSGLDEHLSASDANAEAITAQAADYLFVVTKSIMRFFTPRSFLILGNSELVSRRIAENIRNRWIRELDAFVPEPPMVFSRQYDPLLAQRGASELVLTYYFS
jgi:predicted NBD/HSP70 family sugar kinase